MVILGLGSNIGDRLGYLSAAVRRLAGVVTGLRLSRVLESAALLPEGAPAEWNLPYLNMAVAGTTELSPQELLSEIKTIERELGRTARGVWGPREIDIDILAMDATVMETVELAIPHRELLKRDFALLPLAELAPGWRYPLAGAFKDRSAADIAAAQGFAWRDTGLRVDG